MGSNPISRSTIACPDKTVLARSGGRPRLRSSADRTAGFYPDGRAFESPRRCQSRIELAYVAVSHQNGFCDEMDGEIPTTSP